MVMVKGKSTLFADILASVSKTATARISNLIACRRAFVTGYINYLNYIRVVLIAAHSKLNTLCQNRSFFIYAATHCRLIARNDYCGYIKQILLKCSLPFLFCDLTQHLVFKVLNLRVKFSKLFHSKNHSY